MHKMVITVQIIQEKLRKFNYQRKSLGGQNSKFVKNYFGTNKAPVYPRLRNSLIFELILINFLIKL